MVTISLISGTVPENPGQIVTILDGL
jgi:hypothetical protein